MGFLKESKDHMCCKLCQRIGLYVRLHVRFSGGRKLAGSFVGVGHVMEDSMPEGSEARMPPSDIIAYLPDWDMRMERIVPRLHCRPEVGCDTRWCTSYAYFLLIRGHDKSQSFQATPQ
jgi:hypothetical protein